MTLPRPSTVVFVLLALACVVFALAPRDSDDSYSWSRLEADQQAVLEPLREHWSHSERTERVRLARLARQAAALPEAERLRFQQRLEWWVTLSDEERSLGRETFGQFRAATPEAQRRAILRWAQAQTLSPADTAAETDGEAADGSAPSQPAAVESEKPAAEPAPPGGR